MHFRAEWLCGLAICGFIGGLGVQARAQPVTGPYVGGAGGAAFNTPLRSTTDSTRIDTGVGVAGAGAAGWGFGNGLRTEIEGFYATNSVREVRTHRVDGLLLPLGDPTGSFRNYVAMANLVYDVAVPGWPIVPYLGVGAGYGWLDFHNAGGVGLYRFRLPENNTYTGPVQVSFGNANGFAYQAIAGVAVPVGFVPGLNLTLDYRFVGTDRVDIPVERVALYNQKVNGVVPTAQTHDGFLLHDSVVMVGLRYAFGAVATAPAVAPAPVRPEVAPAPQAARTYLVFFDWDRADLSARAREIVAEAAQASTRVQTTRIEVNGYTDLSGTAVYNQVLSVRRARSVEAELVRDGVAEGAISIRGFGESDPLVATAKGVREPQNRRVEIVLR
jgi:outer membrane protein OmpA-like peptidoglycan-associated protein